MALICEISGASKLTGRALPTVSSRDFVPFSGLTCSTA